MSYSDCTSVPSSHMYLKPQCSCHSTDAVPPRAACQGCGLLLVACVQSCAGGTGQKGGKWEQVWNSGEAGPLVHLILLAGQKLWGYSGVEYSHSDGRTRRGEEEPESERYVWVGPGRAALPLGSWYFSSVHMWWFTVQMENRYLGDHKRNDSTFSHCYLINW